MKKAAEQPLHLKAWEKKNKNCLRCGVPIKDVLWTMDIFYYDFAPHSCNKPKPKRSQ